MGKRLYVGGLSYQTTKEEIEELFKTVGAADVSLVTDRDTGDSKGFAFVEMDTDENALKAIQDFNNYELGGRKLTVNEARPREDRKPSGGGGYGANRGGGSRY